MNNYINTTIGELEAIIRTLSYMLDGMEEYCNINELKEFPAISELNDAIDKLYDTVEELKERK